MVHSLFWGISHTRFDRTLVVAVRDRLANTTCGRWRQTVGDPRLIAQIDLIAGRGQQFHVSAAILRTSADPTMLRCPAT
jgi:hypothetical protein